MKNRGHRRLRLLLERWPHYQHNHQRIQEKHSRLADSVIPVTFALCENSPGNQRCHHDELHNEIDICREGCAGPE
jgi:hypothetical protein